MGTELCSLVWGLGEVRLLKDKIGHLAEEISKPTVEGTVGLFLTIFQ